MTRVRVVLNGVTGDQRKLHVKGDWTVGQFVRRLRDDYPPAKHQSLLFMCHEANGHTSLPPVSKLMADVADNEVVHCSLKTQNTYG